MSGKRWSVLLGGMTALVLASGAAVVAYAGIPDEQGVIHACYGRANGAVRVIDSDAACRPGEAAIDWNVQGRQGLPGEPGSGPDGFVMTIRPATLPTASTSTPPIAILSGLPNGPSFATASLNVQNASGGPVKVICAVGEFGGAYSFDVPGNPGGPGPYGVLVSFSGGSNSSGVPLGCHVWGDPAQPVANVSVSGTLEAIALSSLTVREPQP